MVLRTVAGFTRLQTRKLCRKCNESCKNNVVYLLSSDKICANNQLHTVCLNSHNFTQTQITERCTQNASLFTHAVNLDNAVALFTVPLSSTRSLDDLVKSCNVTVDRSPGLIPFVTCHKRHSVSYPVLCDSKSVTFRPYSDILHTALLPEGQTRLHFLFASHSDWTGHPFSNYWYWLMVVRVIL